MFTAGVFNLDMTEKISRLIKRFSGDRTFTDAFSGSASNFIIRIFGLFAGYVFTLVISRIFGASVLGAHTISSTVLMMFTIVGRLGMDIHIVKKFAGDRMDNRWDRIHEVYRKTLQIGRAHV